MARDPELTKVAEEAAAHFDGKSGYANSGRINGYICDQDRTHRIVTIDREPGVTPFTIQCPICEANNIPNRTGGFYRFSAMTSSMYRVPQDLTPNYEWYRPDTIAEIKEGVLDHVMQGGLLLRKIVDTITVIRPGQPDEVIAVPDLPERPAFDVLGKIVWPHLDGGEMERVNVYWGGRYTDLFVDAEGVEKGLPVNEKATEIYHNNLLTHAPEDLDDDAPKVYGPAVLFSRRVWF